MALEIGLGFDDSQRARVAALYDEAFGAKLSVAIPDRDARVALVAATLDPSCAFVAVDDDRLVGIAGFHAADRSLTGELGLRDLFGRLGVLAGIRAAAVLSLYDRKPRAGQLLMDGIAVDASARGRGVGTRLLEAVREHGRALGCDSIRLDVIDTNPAARRLYERVGFVATRTERFEFLRRWLGFGASTEMVLRLSKI